MRTEVRDIEQRAGEYSLTVDRPLGERRTPHPAEVTMRGVLCRRVGAPFELTRTIDTLLAKRGGGGSRGRRSDGARAAR